MEATSKQTQPHKGKLRHEYHFCLAALKHDRERAELKRSKTWTEYSIGWRRGCSPICTKRGMTERGPPADRTPAKSEKNKYTWADYTYAYHRLPPAQGDNREETRFPWCHHRDYTCRYQGRLRCRYQGRLRATKWKSRRKEWKGVYL